KTGRVYLSIVHGYRDKETRKSRTKTIESLGYLDELEEEYEDPVTFFKQKAERMNQQREAETFAMSFHILAYEHVSEDDAYRNTFAYAPLARIYHDLGIHTILKNLQHHTCAGYDVHNIMKLLHFALLLYPASKKNIPEH